MVIFPEALIFHNHTVVLSFSSESIPEEKEFWIELVYGRHYLKFHQLDASPTDFVAVEVVSGCFPDPHPQASLQGVLWTRQAALLADQGISSYLAGLDQITVSEIQSIS